MAKNGIKIKILPDEEMRGLSYQEAMAVRFGVPVSGNEPIYSSKSNKPQTKKKETVKGFISEPFTFEEY